MKRLGHIAWTTWATVAEIAKKKRDLAIFYLTSKSVFGPFWVGVRRSGVATYEKKTCEPRLHAP